MQKAKTTYPLRPLMQKAWIVARAGARRFGGRAVHYLAAALRQCWAEAKRQAADLAAMKARVQAVVDNLADELRDTERLTVEMRARAGMPAIPAWAMRRPSASRWSAYR